MIYEEIPDQQKRLCIECSNHGTNYESNYTQQIPVGVELYQSSRGCFGRGAIPKMEWKWECLECHEVQF